MREGNSATPSIVQSPLSSKQSDWPIMGELPVTGAVCLGAMLLPELDLFPVLRLICGILAVLWLPGFTLGLCLWPGRSDISRALRLVFGFGLSLALFSCVALLQQALHIPLSGRTVAVTSAVVTVGLQIIVAVRRLGLRPVDRWYPSQSSGRFYALATIGVLTTILAGFMPLDDILTRDSTTELAVVSSQPVDVNTWQVVVATVSHEATEVLFGLAVQGEVMLQEPVASFILQPQERHTAEVVVQLRSDRITPISLNLIVPGQATPYRTVTVKLSPTEMNETVPSDGSSGPVASPMAPLEIVQ